MAAIVRHGFTHTCTVLFYNTVYTISVFVIAKQLDWICDICHQDISMCMMCHAAMEEETNTFPLELILLYN